MGKSDCNPCHWVAHVRGGEPLSVSTCSLCGQVNWALLAEDFREAAREFACGVMEGAYGRHDYPDGSKSLCERGMVNVIQVYRLFSKEPGQDGCSLPPRPRSRVATVTGVDPEGDPYHEEFVIRSWGEAPHVTGWPSQQ